MADNKDFLLGNKARELLCYTKHATRVVSDDASRRDVRMILHKIAQLEDIREVQKVCGEAVQMIDRSSREGFTKSNFRLYGEDMRVIAKSILRNILSANNQNFAAEPRARIRKINDVLDDCTLLLEYIQLCLDEKIIDVKKAGVWTKMVTDVKYMAIAWKKKSQEMARKPEAERRAAEDARIEAIVRRALANDG